MEYVYSAMLLHAAEKEITEEAITKIMTAAGVKVEDARVKAMVAALDGVDIAEAIKTAAAPAAPAAAPAAADAPAEKKEEPKEEKKEEEASAGLGALFG
ncbi:MAG: 50S ribosomal protein P1 [Candidatus Diapherotrites archaeon]|nr:50S ribosomal protein P1 [Candidatus Diapherotrites archaeon]